MIIPTGSTADIWFQEFQAPTAGNGNRPICVLHFDQSTNAVIARLLGPPGDSVFIQNEKKSK